MKQILLTTLCCIVISTLFAQKPDTSVTDSWTGSAWVHTTRSINTYDGNCVLQTSLLQKWSVSLTWIDTALTTYSYNGNGQITEILFQIGDGTTWTNVLRTRNVYNSGTSLLDTSYGDFWQSGSWQTLTRTTYTYNGDNTTYQSLLQTNLLGWTNTSQTTYAYNSDKTVKYDSSQSWNIFPPKWVNASKNNYTYNGSGKLTQNLLQIWKSGAWSNSELYTFTLNGNGDPTTILIQQWNGSSWDNFEQTTIHYSSCISLPLTLLNFSASKNSSTVSLNWKTTNEVNTSYFIVQRSTDGIHYSNVGQVSAKGNIAATNDYSYADNISTIKTGTVYYRLQMVDKDGRSSTSKIASVTINASGIEFSIKPNPAKNFIVITAGSAAGSNSALVSVTDFTGHVVVKKTISTSGDQTIDISSLQRGVYIVSIKAGDITTTKKLVVE